jgi:hypothetical protein
MVWDIGSTNIFKPCAEIAAPPSTPFDEVASLSRDRRAIVASFRFLYVFSISSNHPPSIGIVIQL